MAYCLSRKEGSSSKGFRRILIEQVDGLVADLRKRNRTEAIHEARKRCKHIRALIRLLRPVAGAFYRRENRIFREMAHALSTLRDTEVRLETFHQLVESDRGHSAKPIGALLKAEQRESASRPAHHLRDMMETSRKSRKRFEHLQLHDGSGFDVIEEGLRTSYRRGRKGCRRASVGAVENSFHEWRKRVKDLGYQMHLLRGLWPDTLKPLQEELEELGDILGKEHDLNVLRDHVRTHRKKFPRKMRHRFLALLKRRAKMLQKEAEVLGRRLYAEPPQLFIKRVATYWKIWQQEKVAP